MPGKLQMKRIEACQVSVGMTLGIICFSIRKEGIALSVKDLPKNKVEITTTCGKFTFGRSAMLELVEVK